MQKGRAVRISSVQEVGDGIEWFVFHPIGGAFWLEAFAFSTATLVLSLRTEGFPPAQGISTRYFGGRVGRGFGWCKVDQSGPQRGYQTASEHDFLNG